MLFLACAGGALPFSTQFSIILNTLHVGIIDQTNRPVKQQAPQDQIYYLCRNNQDGPASRDSVVVTAWRARAHGQRSVGHPWRRGAAGHAGA